MLLYALLVLAATFFFLLFGLPPELAAYGTQTTDPAVRDMLTIGSAPGPLALISFLVTLCWLVYGGAVISWRPRSRQYFLREDALGFLPLLLAPAVGLLGAASFEGLESHLILLQVWATGLVLAVLGLKAGLLAYTLLDLPPAGRRVRLLALLLVLVGAALVLVELWTGYLTRRESGATILPFYVWSFLGTSSGTDISSRHLYLVDLGMIAPAATCFLLTAILAFLGLALRRPPRSRLLGSVALVLVLGAGGAFGYKALFGAMFRCEACRVFDQRIADQGRRLTLPRQPGLEYLAHGPGDRLQLRLRPGAGRGGTLSLGGEQLEIDCPSGERVALALGLVPEAEAFYQPRFRLSYVLSAAGAAGIAPAVLEHRSRADRYDPRFSISPLPEQAATLDLQLQPGSGLSAPFALAGLVCQGAVAGAGP